MERLIGEILGRMGSSTKPAISEALRSLIQKSQERVGLPPIVAEKKNWDKEAAKEVARQDVIYKINEQLKPLGYVLILHFNPKDLEKIAPVSATFERWNPA